MTHILLTELRISDGSLRPLDINFWVVPHDASICFRTVHIIHFIAEYCSVAQDQETMCESSRDVELPVIVLRQLYCYVLAEVGLDFRMSTATSSTLPQTTLTSLDWAASPF